MGRPVDVHRAVAMGSGCRFEFREQMAAPLGHASQLALRVLARVAELLDAALGSRRLHLDAFDRRALRLEQLDRPYIRERLAVARAALGLDVMEDPKDR